MKIALIAPAEEIVPPPKYGGTELVVANLANGLVARGHEVHLFAAEGAQTDAILHPVFEGPIRQKLLDMESLDNVKLRLAYNYVAAARAVELVAEQDFDIIHNHMTWRLLALQKVMPAPLLTTWHGALSEEYMKAVNEYYAGSYFTSISHNQRKAYPNLNYVGNAYNGIDVSSFTFNDKPQDYLAFLGRIAPEKGTREAILLAKAAGKKLIIAAKKDAADDTYFKEQVEPLIDGEQIVYIGEVGHEEKVKLLAGAQATLGLIQWEEPFGLFVVESLACGTPVVGVQRGAMQEILEDGKTGFLIPNSQEAALEALRNIGTIDRAYCRHVVEERFSIEAMVKSYEGIYAHVLELEKAK